ncbi:uncharacterized protein LOC118436247 [Folsomia candida]|uniref:Protein sleepless n=1 Tax=Folsomia candida TaxID=158441 RepID=A0A226E4M7_FOLCA|nr:uncharacterized protein LOC118436247 [Folsomia candida]OXA51446.1 hypothetical protein Fcan01_13878 [Folsomia candida]
MYIFITIIMALPSAQAGLKCYWCIGELDATMENWSSINRLNKIHQRFGEQIIPKCDTVKNDDTDFSWDCGNERGAVCFAYTDRRKGRGCLSPAVAKILGKKTRPEPGTCRKVWVGGEHSEICYCNENYCNMGETNGVSLASSQAIFIWMSYLLRSKLC